MTDELDSFFHSGHTTQIVQVCSHFDLCYCNLTTAPKNSDADVSH